MATTTKILGSRKAAVDVMLSGWAVREDIQSKYPVRVIRYATKDVTIIVHFQSDIAVGASVIDNPSGCEGISAVRFNELTEIIGGEPTAEELVRDAKGVHLFRVGDFRYADEIGR